MTLRYQLKLLLLAAVVILTAGTAGRSGGISLTAEADGRAVLTNHSDRTWWLPEAGTGLSPGTAICISGFTGGSPAVVELTGPRAGEKRRISFSPPQTAHQQLMQAEAQWLAGQQRSDGAFPMRMDAPEHRVVPYYGNLAVMGLLLAGNQQVPAKKWMQWYLDHLEKNASAGTISDYAGKPDGPLVSTGTCDSEDAYAATFLTLCRTYGMITGDLAWLRSREADIRSVADVLVRLQQPDGLLWTRQQVRVKYLMDNSECAEGFRSMVWLEKCFGGNAQPWQDRAERVTSAVSNKMSGSDKAVLRPYLNLNDDGRMPDPSLFYPDMTSQLFPIWTQLPLEPKFLQGLWTGFVNRYPRWNQAPAEDAFPWMLTGLSAATAGITGGTEDYLRKVAAPYVKDHAYPWYILESGTLIRILEKQLENFRTFIPGTAQGAWFWQPEATAMTLSIRATSDEEAGQVLLDGEEIRYSQLKAGLDREMITKSLNRGIHRVEMRQADGSPVNAFTAVVRPQASGSKPDMYRHGDPDKGGDALWQSAKGLQGACDDAALWIQAPEKEGVIYADTDGDPGTGWHSRRWTATGFDICIKEGRVFLWKASLNRWEPAFPAETSASGIIRIPLKDIPAGNDPMRLAMEGTRALYPPEGDAPLTAGRWSGTPFWPPAEDSRGFRSQWPDIPRASGQNIALWGLLEEDNRLQVWVQGVTSGDTNLFADLDQKTETGYSDRTTGVQGADIMLQKDKVWFYAGSGKDWSWAATGHHADFEPREDGLHWQVPLQPLNAGKGMRIRIMYGRLTGSAE